MGCTLITPQEVHYTRSSGLCQLGGYQFREAQSLRPLKDTLGSLFSLHPELTGAGPMLSPNWLARLFLCSTLSRKANFKGLLRVPQLTKPMQLSRQIFIHTRPLPPAFRCQLRLIFTSSWCLGDCAGEHSSDVS